MDRLKNFGFLLKDVSRRYVQRFEHHATRHVADAGRSAGRSPGSRRTRASARPGSPSMTEVEPMAMVRILDRMEADGLLERRPDPDDRRARRLHLTREGQAAARGDLAPRRPDARRDLRRHRARRARGLHRRARAARQQPAARSSSRSRASPTQAPRGETRRSSPRPRSDRRTRTRIDSPDEHAADRPAPGPPIPPAHGRRAAPARSWKQRLRLPLMLFGPIVVALVAAYFYLSGGRYESTDDAYVQAARVAISANVAGRVVELDVRDNQLGASGATCCFASTTRRSASPSTRPRRSSRRRACRSSR